MRAQTWAGEAEGTRALRVCVLGGGAVAEMATSLQSLGCAVKLEAGDRIPGPGLHADVAVVDVGIAMAPSIAWVANWRAEWPAIPLILVAPHDAMDRAWEGVRQGAHAAMPLPVDGASLMLGCWRAVEHARMLQELRQLRRAISKSSSLGEMVTASGSMRGVVAALEHAAASDGPLLFTGEQGTGRGLAARVVHQQSNRRTGPFVSVDCSVVPATAVVSGVLGREDAGARLLTQATGGTLFLEDVDMLPPGVRFQLGSVLASNHPGVRVMASSQDTGPVLGSWEAERVVMPPLNARGEDVLLLAQHFLAGMAARTGKPVAGLSSAASACVIAYAWPGNIRELRTAMERSVLRTREAWITVGDLPQRVREAPPLVTSEVDEKFAEMVPMEELERRHILQVLRRLHGNKAEAARVLGLDRKTLYRKLERYSSSARATPEA